MCQSFLVSTCERLADLVPRRIHIASSIGHCRNVSRSLNRLSVFRLEPLLQELWSGSLVVLLLPRYLWRPLQSARVLAYKRTYERRKFPTTATSATVTLPTATPPTSPPAGTAPAATIRSRPTRKTPKNVLSFCETVAAARCPSSCCKTITVKENDPAFLLHDHRIRPSRSPGCEDHVEIGTTIKYPRRCRNLRVLAYFRDDKGEWKRYKNKVYRVGRRKTSHTITAMDHQMEGHWWFWWDLSVVGQFW